MLGKARSATFDDAGDTRSRSRALKVLSTDDGDVMSHSYVRISSRVISGVAP